MRPACTPLLALALFAFFTTGCHRVEPVSKKAALSDADRRTLAEFARRLAEKEARRKKQTVAPAPSPSASDAPSSVGDAPSANQGRSIASDALGSARPLPSPSDVPEAAPAPAPAGSVTSAAPRVAPWIVDERASLGPTSPATATSFGVIANSIDGELAIARLGAPSHRPSAAPTPIESLPPDLGPFGLGRGPGLFEDFVYWISHGSLVRRRLVPGRASGPLEILAKDAFDGTRVGVPLPSGSGKPAKIPATVAYIVRPEKDDAPLVAKLWVEGRTPEVLTAEGNSTHSVSLVRTEDGVLAVSLQARMAMTPAHARRIRFAEGRPLLGDDVVVWVGGGIQPLTEMTLLPHGEHGLLGFIPHERSMQEFGVARLDIGMSPSMDTEASWMLYPNGIDPAPVAAGHLCGEPVVLYAAPISATPGSQQKLVLRSLDDPSGARSVRIATAHAFYFASFAEAPGGALAVWTDGRGTEASTVRCTTRPK